MQINEEGVTAGEMPSQRDDSEGPEWPDVPGGVSEF